MVTTILIIAATASYIWAFSKIYKGCPPSTESLKRQEIRDKVSEIKLEIPDLENIINTKIRELLELPPEACVDIKRLYNLIIEFPEAHKHIVNFYKVKCWDTPVFQNMVHIYVHEKQTPLHLLDPSDVFIPGAWPDIYHITLDCALYAFHLEPYYYYLP